MGIFKSDNHSENCYNEYKQYYKNSTKDFGNQVGREIHSEPGSYDPSSGSGIGKMLFYAALVTGGIFLFSKGCSNHDTGYLDQQEKQMQVQTIDIKVAEPKYIV